MKGSFIERERKGGGGEDKRRREGERVVKRQKRGRDGDYVLGVSTSSEQTLTHV